MKYYFKKIISIIVSVFIVMISSLSCSFYSYAFSPEDFVGNTVWRDMSTSDKWQTIFLFICADMKAIYNGDPKSFLEGRTAINEFINAHDPDDFVNEEGLSIPADFVALIKQALQEYADETNPFKIQPTYSYKSIPAGLFPSKQTYNAFTSYCASHYMVAFSFPSQVSDLNTNMLLGDVSEVVDDGGGFVTNGSTGFYTVNSNWSKAPVWRDYYAFQKDESGEYIVSSIKERSQQCTAFLNYNATTATFRHNLTTGYLVTKDGGRIRVFNSLAEFKDYNAGQRKVFFGSDFYDFDPTEITATWDEIADTINHMDDIMQDILDAINNNPNISEEELEKLIDDLLGKIGEIGDKTDETNSILGEIASSLSGYFDSVLGYLEEILSAIEALVWIEIDDKLDEDKTDLFDLIDKIWDNPEEGSQEAADTLTGSFSEIAGGITKKFPFSIPWDIYNLFRVFSGTPPPRTAAYRALTLGSQPFTIDSHDLEQDTHDAPYFIVPFKIESCGIYEEIIIDLKDFTPLSTLSRALLSVLFGVTLIKFTIRIIELFKGGAGD